MATTYRYNFLGFGLTIGYIEFTMSPEPGEPVFPGKPITISGKINSNSTHGDTWKTFYFGLPKAYGGIVFKMPITVKKGKTVSFNASFELDQESLAAMPTRFESIPFAYSPKDSDGSYYDEDESWQLGCSTYAPDDVDEDGNNWVEKIHHSPDVEEDFRIFLGKYSLTPQILALDFERATASGQWADDGQYLQCKALKLSINSQASIGDIATAKLSCTGSDGSSREVSLTRAQLEAALSSSGYSESKPGIFAGFTSSLGVTYTLTLTLGDAYDQTSLADVVMRSFARLHFSGAKNGGVAVGMFSSATDSQPKFEVAENHTSYFYGPAHMPGRADIPGINSYQEGEHLTGGTWIDGKPIYRYVWRGSVKISSNKNDIFSLPNPLSTLLHVYGSVGSSQLYPIGFAHPGGLSTAFSITILSNETVRLLTGSSISGTYSVVVVLEYTRA